MILTRLALPLALGIASLSCAGDAPCETFIALNRDFVGYRSWPSHHVGNAPLAGHPIGDRTVYINHLPPAGSTS